MFVEWDRNGKISSESMHQFGSATLDETSSHYADQTPLFADERTKPVRLDWLDLAPHIRESYRPGTREKN